MCNTGTKVYNSSWNDANKKLAKRIKAIKLFQKSRSYSTEWIRVVVSQLENLQNVWRSTEYCISSEIAWRRCFAEDWRKEKTEAKPWVAWAHPPGFHGVSFPSTTLVHWSSPRPFRWATSHNSSLQSLRRWNSQSSDGRGNKQMEGEMERWREWSNTLQSWKREREQPHIPNWWSGGVEAALGTGLDWRNQKWQSRGFLLGVLGGGGAGLQVIPFDWLILLIDREGGREGHTF